MKDSKEDAVEQQMNGTLYLINFKWGEKNLYSIHINWQQKNLTEVTEYSAVSQTNLFCPDCTTRTGHLNFCPDFPHTWILLFKQVWHTSHLWVSGGWGQTLFSGAQRQDKGQWAQTEVYEVPS